MHQNNSSGSLGSRIAGAGIAGSAELMLFHPVDTVAKRMMNSKVAVSWSNYGEVIFQDSGSGWYNRGKTLFPGIGFGAAYKITQRMYKFAGQPFVNEKLENSLLFKKHSTFLTNAIAGAIVGAGEVALLPLDALKIKKQTNSEYRKLAVSEICKREGLKGLYAGASYTALRNVMGSFMLFGVNAFVKERQQGTDRSFGQLAVSSTAGSIASILVACPLDVVKTRMQSGQFAGIPGSAIIKAIIKEEGVGAFFKGAVPKVCTVGPKLVFSFTLAQYLAGLFNTW